MTLRIQRTVEGDLAIFKLIGRIQAADVPELLALLKSESPEHSILMDLTEVKLVDRDAVFFLALSETVGARLRNCPGYIREWINQERIAMDRKKTEDPTGFPE